MVLGSNFAANNFRRLNHDFFWCWKDSSGRPFCCLLSLFFSFCLFLSFCCFWLFCLSFLPPLSPIIILLFRSWLEYYLIDLSVAPMKDESCRQSNVSELSLHEYGGVRKIFWDCWIVAIFSHPFMHMSLGISRFSHFLQGEDIIEFPSRRPVIGRNASRWTYHLLLFSGNLAVGSSIRHIWKAHIEI